MSTFFNTGLSAQQFLDEYWRKKPLLIRQAFPDFVSPITPEELAGLACEAGIESRLIEEDKKTGDWKLTHGPLSEQVFSRLPESHWTILVQDVEKHLPELQAFIEPFQFIPDWRRDDLMISYAAKAGSVGPHTDGYDVFLLQAMGRRRWQIGDQPLIEPELLEGLDLQILAEFSPTHEWELEAGDMLYLPPHFAHHGVALDDCMTFSIGFRAPTQIEVMDALVEGALEYSFGTKRYADPDLKVNAHFAEIDGQTIARMRAFLHDMIDEASPQLATILGQLVTQTKPSLDDLAQGIENTALSASEIAAQFLDRKILQRNLYQRFAWTNSNRQGQLFVAGEVYTVDEEVIPYLPIFAEKTQITLTDWNTLQQSAASVSLLCQLLANGSWYWTS